MQVRVYCLTDLDKTIVVLYRIANKKENKNFVFGKVQLIVPLCVTSVKIWQLCKLKYKSSRYSHVLYTDKYLLLAKPIVLTYQNYIKLKLDFASLLWYETRIYSLFALFPLVQFLNL